MCISPRPPIHCNFPEQEFSSAEQQTDIWPDLLSFSNTFFSHYFVATVCCLLSFACSSPLFFLDKKSVQPLLPIAQQQCNLTCPSFLFLKLLPLNFMLLPVFFFLVIFNAHLIFSCVADSIAPKQCNVTYPAFLLPTQVSRETICHMVTFQKCFLDFTSVYTHCCFCSTVGVCCQCMI